MNESPSHAAWHPRADRLWLFVAGLWLAPALFFSTQQWAALRETPKAMSWIAAFLYQAPSWLLLIPASVALFHLIPRYPLDRAHIPRVFIHAALSAGFGVLFLLVAVPVRHAFHPSPVRWTFFGETLFKSAPQFIALGVGAYWFAVLVTSLIETRQRLAATIERVDRAPDRPRAAAPMVQSWRVTLKTPAGQMLLPGETIEWMEPAPGGSCIHLPDEEILVRHSLAELESIFMPRGFLRIHRSVLVNTHAVREVRGAPSRDGVVVLESGRQLPVSRRRRAELDANLATRSA